MNYKYALKWLKNALVSLSLLSLIAISACGGGGDSAVENTDDTGTVLIGITDAEGDFVSYGVDVLSIKMTHVDGRVVETLPVSSRIDFAEYVNLTEFITAATVPTGRYVKGSMTLDFSNADIWVEGTTGEAVKVNTITDINGDVVTTMELSVNLDGLNSLPVAPGIPKHLTLDFDLKESNVVTVSGDSASIVVEPKLIASVDLNKPKQHRLRGPLKSVDVANNNFQLLIRPFRHHLTKYNKHFGVLKVGSSDVTLYEIDGISYEGTAGLEVLNTMAQLTGVIVRGKVQFKPLRFEAQQVYAGSSVPGGTLDVVKGSVISRTANVIKVHGATVTRADSSIVFNDSITVQLADSTIVKVQQSMADHTIVDLSVGSKVTLFGTVTDETSTNYQFDASNGYARVSYSDLKGAVVGLVSTLILDLHSINGRTASLYNFAGTGIDSFNDAQVGNYEVDIGTLNLSFPATTALAVRGLVRHFGSAPQDFNAQTVVELSTTVAAN